MCVAMDASCRLKIKVAGVQVLVWSTFPLTMWLCLLIIPLAVSQEVLSFSKFGVQWRQLQLVHAYNTSTAVQSMAAAIRHEVEVQARMSPLAA